MEKKSLVFLIGLLNLCRLLTESKLSNLTLKCCSVWVISGRVTGQEIVRNTKNIFFFYFFHLNSHPHFSVNLPSDRLLTPYFLNFLNIATLPTSEYHMIESIIVFLLQKELHFFFDFIRNSKTRYTNDDYTKFYLLNPWYLTKASSALPFVV